MSRQIAIAALAALTVAGCAYDRLIDQPIISEFLAVNEILKNGHHPCVYLGNNETFDAWNFNVRLFAKARFLKEPLRTTTILALRKRLESKGAC